MNIYIWLMVKKGEPRVYTTHTGPSDEQYASWRAQGFKVYRLGIDLPDEPDAVVYATSQQEVGEEQLDHLRDLGLVGWSDPPKEPPKGC